MVTLIVDDLQDMRELIQVNLELAYPHMSFIHASNGHEAISLIEKYGACISLIVCDYNMPGGNGDIVFLKWQEKLFYTPFVMLTSEIHKARNKILKGERNLWQRLSFQEKENGFDKLPSVVNRLVEKSFINIPLEWFKEGLPFNYPLHIALSDKKVIQYSHKGDVVELTKIRELKNKGAKGFFIPMKEVLEEKLKWPNFEIHSRDNKSTPGLLAAFNNFKVVHNTVLADKVFEREGLEKACLLLEKDVERFSKTDFFIWYNEKGLTLKNYIINHSFLISLIGNMALKELGLDSITNRKNLLEGVLFHDLFKSDDQAYQDDLLEKSLTSEEVKNSQNNLMQLNSVADDYGLSSDCKYIIEALCLHRCNVRGNSEFPKVARIARIGHHIVSDLYKSSFVLEVTTERLYSDDEDKNLSKALGQIFV